MCIRDRAGAAAEMLPELRGSEDPLERQKKIEGRCGRCVHFALCGGGFRTRAAFANGQVQVLDIHAYFMRVQRIECL